MGVSIGKCGRQPRFSIGKCGRQPRFSIGKCGNTNLSRGGIIPKWAGKLPKQELFHRNLEPRRRVKETSPHPLGTRARKLHMVGAVGLEPSILAARDFKSPAYANSATTAYLLYRSPDLINITLLYAICPAFFYYILYTVLYDIFFDIN